MWRQEETGSPGMGSGGDSLQPAVRSAVHERLMAAAGRKGRGAARRPAQNPQALITTMCWVLACFFLCCYPVP
jgi:hypothetical protein